MNNNANILATVTVWLLTLVFLFVWVYLVSAFTGTSPDVVASWTALGTACTAIVRKVK